MEKSIKLQLESEQKLSKSLQNKINSLNLELSKFNKGYDKLTLNRNCSITPQLRGPTSMLQLANIGIGAAEEGYRDRYVVLGHMRGDFRGK